MASCRLLWLYCACVAVHSVASDGPAALLDVRDRVPDYKCDYFDGGAVISCKLQQQEDMRMATEMTVLRNELATLRKESDSKARALQDELTAARATLQNLGRHVESSTREIYEGLSKTKLLAENVDLGLKLATTQWNITIHDMQFDFEEESSSVRTTISEIQSTFEQKVNTLETVLDSKIRLDTSRDELIQSLNSTVQMRAEENDIKFKKLANESEAIRSLEFGIGSINSTLNRMLGLEEPKLEPDTDPNVNASFRRIGPLKLVVSSAKLPTPRAYSSAVYDGRDSIYIIGGTDGSTRYDNVLKYSLLSGAVEITTTFLKRRSGSAIMDGEFITYFGGYSGEDEESGIYRISPTKWGYSHVGSLPVKTCCMGAAWDPLNRTAYLFGGYNSGASLDQILSYSAATHQPTHAGALPEKRPYIASSWDSKRKVAHLFSRNDTWQFTPPNIVTSHKPLPYTLTTAPCSVYASANDHVYVFGGGGRLIKYNPTNHISTLMDVQMWPQDLHGAACVYVPKQHRMYIFGGYGRQRDGESDKFRDEIAFIDLGWP